MTTPQKRHRTAVECEIALAALDEERQQLLARNRELEASNAALEKAIRALQKLSEQE